MYTRTHPTLHQHRCSTSLSWKGVDWMEPPKMSLTLEQDFVPELSVYVSLVQPVLLAHDFL